MVSDMKHQTDAAGRGSIVKYSRVSQRCQHTMVHVSLCPHAVEPTSHCAFVSLHLDIAAAPFHSGELWTRKLKSHLLRTQSLKILPLKPGVGQYIAIHAMLPPGISSLLISTLPVHSPAFFSKTSPEFFLCSLRLTLVPV